MDFNWIMQIIILIFNHKSLAFKQVKQQLQLIRTEVKGMNTIQKYCNTNNINLEESSPSISFMQKTIKQGTDKQKSIFPLITKDFEFRVN